jgi:putative transposase
MRHPMHDYSLPGGYFITFSTHKRIPLLSSLSSSVVTLSSSGEQLLQCWRDLPSYYPAVITDAARIMPDHFHGILIVADPKLKQIDEFSCTNLPEMIRGLKSMSARKINQVLKRSGAPVWQRGYHDRIIRSDAELEKYRYYIETNPLRLQPRR